MSTVSKGLYLIDTSVWIEVLRNRADAALRRRVESALHENRAAMTAPVWMELFRGVRGKREMDRLVALRRLCTWLHFDETCWELATQISRTCREKRLQILTGDILVFACAKHYGCEIIECDKHFSMIAKATKA